VTSPWTGASIRVRLTAWYTLVLTATMILYAAATFVAVRHEFMQQLDSRLHDDFEGAEGLLARTPDGRIAWIGERHHDAAEAEASVYEVWSATGEPLHRSGAAVSLPAANLTAVSAYAYDTVVAEGKRWRTLTAPITIGGRADVLRVSRSAEPVESQLSEVLLVLALGLPLVVALAGVGGYTLARRALRPIDRLAQSDRRDWPSGRGH
jgi:hypothetical protein